MKVTIVYREIGMEQFEVEGKDRTIILENYRPAVIRRDRGEKIKWKVARQFWFYKNL